MPKTVLILLIFTGFISCNPGSKEQKQPHDLKSEQIQMVIKKSGFVELPLVFDANNENSLKRKYDVDFRGNDSLVFDKDVWNIIGFLPDTAEFYAFLFNSVGDMLYPTLVTLDKKGNKIDRQVICAGGCAGHAALDVISCYDSVWIYPDLKIKSISKVTGTVDTEDAILKTFNICNMRILDGFIETSGKIKLKDSELIDCSD